MNMGLTKSLAGIRIIYDDNARKSRPGSTGFPLVLKLLVKNYGLEKRPA